MSDSFFRIVMEIPCRTLYYNTEHLETITILIKELIRTDPSTFRPELEKLFAGEWETFKIPKLCMGKATERIVHQFENGR